MEKNKRLYRSSKSKVFGGVAGGIAEYFDIDPIIIRILFLVIALAGGGGAIVYLIMWIAIPLEPFAPFTMNSSAPFSENASQEGTENTSTDFTKTVTDPKRGGLIGGIILISLGLMFFAGRVLPNINFHQLWPLVLVVIGGILIATSIADKKNESKS